ncbi:MAG TPA: hypothetical protein VKY27_05240 [Bacteriovoracaceae bacterium]|nr:hypothetical protein [Bacteriovoracaceae bacterium]
MKSVVIFFLLLFFASALPAVVVAPNSQCPDQFIGKVSAVIEPTVDSALAINKVVFTNIEQIEGHSKETVLVDVLKNGMIKTKIGDVFEVSLRKGVLCQLRKLDHH